MPLDWTKGSPWNWNLSKISKKKLLPEGFVELYGEKPSWKDFQKTNTHFEYRVIIVQWETKLKHYKGLVTTLPLEIDRKKLLVAEGIYNGWGMADITWYNSTYGIKGRFLDSDLPDYSFSLHHLVEFPQHVVSQYQIEQILRQMPTPNPLHFFVPPGIGGVINKVEEDE